MGMLLILTIICIVLMILGIVLYACTVYQFVLKGIGALFAGVFGFVSVCFVIILIVTFLSHLTREYNAVNAQYERTKLNRLLHENYNPENLNEALAFNIMQQKSANYNKGFLMYCWNNCYSVDTIDIPVIKYTPTNKIELDVVNDK